MNAIWLYGLGSVMVVSLMSFAGIFTLSFKTERLKRMLLYMVSFAAGTFLGDAFLHLLPEIIEENGFTISISFYILAGIAFFFIVEKIIHWRHCHHPTTKDHPHTFAWTNLLGDGVHNFLDGLIIGAAYLVSIPVGVATTLAIVLHEIPQEIADFSILIHSGFSRGKALLLNFFSALLAVLGTIIALLLSAKTEGLTTFLVPFAAGGFIYIALSDLIPELHKEENWKKSVLQLFAFAIGIAIMFSLLLNE